MRSSPRPGRGGHRGRGAILPVVPVAVIVAAMVIALMPARGAASAASPPSTPVGLGRLATPSAVNPPDGLGRTPLVNLPEPGSQVAAEGTSPTRKAGTTTLDNIFYGVSC